MDLALLWQWRRPVATALIRLLAWEPPYAADVAPPKKDKTERLYKAFNFLPLRKVIGGEEKKGKQMGDQ